MSKESIIRPEDMEMAKQVLMAVGNVEIDEWPDDNVDLYRGAWLALDKSGVEASEYMLAVIGTVHHALRDQGGITPEGIEKYAHILRWDDSDLRSYRYEFRENHQPDLPGHYDWDE